MDATEQATFDLRGDRIRAQETEILKLRAQVRELRVELDASQRALAHAGDDTWSPWASNRYFNRTGEQPLSPSEHSRGRYEDGTYE